MLDAPLGPRATLTALARSAVPRLADWCSVSIPAEDGIEVVAVAHVRPAEGRARRGAHPPLPARPGRRDRGRRACFAPAGREFVPAITPEPIDAAVPPGEQRHAIRRARPRLRHDRAR